MKQPGKKITDKKLTFKYFDYKWKKVPQWARQTEPMYQQWYLKRYGYGTKAKLATFLRGKHRILEAGCGLARDSKMFAELNPRAEIVAMDQSPSALKVARKTLRPYPHCRTVRADITRFRGQGLFDFISCDQVLHHTPVPAKTLRHLYNQLAPGGVLVTRFGKALYELGIRPVAFQNRRYEDLQRFVHNQVFRCWYNPSIDFTLSVSSNYDWFSGNPRFDAAGVRAMMKRGLGPHRVLRFFEDDASISVSIRKASHV